MFFQNTFKIIIELIYKRISVFEKRIARTYAIIRVWDYPNKPDLAKVVPIRIGTLLASYRCDNGSWRKSAYSYEYALLAKY